MFIVHGKPNCPFCSKAIELLNKNSLKVTYFDITAPENQQVLENLVLQGYSTVPQIYFNDSYIGGYEDLVVHLNSKVRLAKRTVIKRNGKEGPFEADKINSMAEWAVTGNPNVQWSEIVMDAMEKLEGNQLKTDDIQDALIKACLDKDSESHNKVAGRLLLGDLRKKIITSKEDFVGFYTYMVENKYWADMDMSVSELTELKNAINHDRDLTTVS